MNSERKNILLVVPSMLVARGLEAILDSASEFRVSAILSGISSESIIRLKNTGADIIIIDPIIFDYSSRANARSAISQYSDAAIVGLRTVNMDDESWKQYDETINIYDSPPAIVKKLRSALAIHQEAPRSDGDELSAREKEILVCVAKGMLNKEIADQLNLSIYTVITHRKNITRKTGIKTVAGLTVYALLNNLIDYSSVE
ncbi:MAG: LuxR C-terminal-related transcriptional regulator [Bacteroidales bacterium]|nr:LuxR C-terminal-related transcriptional regulator [Bacteroidales bacterium]MDE6872762.1 LuxR C-terminal-related transcriptional regulator [Bacteroidales bacterium]MDE7128339.1 LuxR C-terminal-related transcriptional regulator [Bacteroidales bacterium]